VFVSYSGVPTRQRVADLLAAGLSRAEVARVLGLGKGTVTDHARRLGEPIDERCNRRYDWRVVQAYYDEGNSITACQRQFGFARATFAAAVKRGEVTSRPHAMPIERLLSGRRNRNHVKGRLIRAGLKQNRCEGCGIATWLGQPLSLALHHLNGAQHDNRFVI
jgi:hypothetical protein